MRIFIENEAGSDRKNRYDEQTLVWRSASPLRAPYPYPYGFVLDTRGDSGDAVDCFLISLEPIRSGSIVVAEPVGLLEQIEDGEIDHKVLAALPGTAAVIDERLHADLRAFIEEVFRAFPGVRLEVGRLLDAAAARAFLERRRA